MLKYIYIFQTEYLSILKLKMNKIIKFYKYKINSYLTMTKFAYMFFILQQQQNNSILITSKV